MTREEKAEERNFDSGKFIEVEVNLQEREVLQQGVWGERERERERERAEQKCALEGGRIRERM